jgi:hypothetical protein
VLRFPGLRPGLTEPALQAGIPRRHPTAVLNRTALRVDPWFLCFGRSPRALRSLREAAFAVANVHEDRPARPVTREPAFR